MNEFESSDLVAHQNYQWVIESFVCRTDQHCLGLIATWLQSPSIFCLDSYKGSHYEKPLLKMTFKQGGIDWLTSASQTLAACLGISAIKTTPTLPVWMLMQSSWYHTCSQGTTVEVCMQSCAAYREWLATQPPCPLLASAPANASCGQSLEVGGCTFGC